MKKQLFFLAILLFVLGCTQSDIQIPDKDSIKEVINTTLENENINQFLNETIENVKDVVQNVTNQINETITNVKINSTSKSNLSTSNQSYLPNERCQDTDVTEEFPDGINYFLKGDIKVNGKPIKYGYDYCANAAKISEWYCQNGIARVKTVDCQNGCKDGVCLK